jgi:cytochrome c-type biogenesis protein CcmF
VLFTILGEVGRGLKVQSAVTGNVSYSGANIAALIRRHRVKYGAHLIHFGVLILTVAITASMAHKIEKEFTLGRGEAIQVGRFSIALQDISNSRAANYEALQVKATVSTIKDGTHVTELRPELRFYPKNETTTTEVALHMGAREDVYLVLAGLDATGTKASMKVYINPLQVWLWYGAIVMVLGGLIVAVPQARAVALDKGRVVTQAVVNEV